MSEYNSNYEIAQAISERIGTAPIPFDSVYEICLAIYNELGGEPAQFDSVYEILLGILPLAEGGSSRLIDDEIISTEKTWSSSKISSELEQVDVDPITNVNELPEASENKNKFFRLSSDDNVYVSELKSRTTTTTNRLPDTQQIDKAYLYANDGWQICYYKGATVLHCSDGDVNGYLWYQDDDIFYISKDNAEIININSLVTYGEDLNNYSIVDGDVYVDDAIDDVEWDIYTFIPIPAIYNAPESAQIGNAYLNNGSDNPFIYKGELEVECTNGNAIFYYWDAYDEWDSTYLTKIPASEIVSDTTGKYCATKFNLYSNMNFSGVDTLQYNGTVDECYNRFDNNSFTIGYMVEDGGGLYIPQLNAPDSEQVGNATINDAWNGSVYTYKDNWMLRHTSDGSSTGTVIEERLFYGWYIGEPSGDISLDLFVTVLPPSEIYTDDYIAGGDISFYTDLDETNKIIYTDTQIDTLIEGVFTPENEHINNANIVKYQRTEVIEEWDWQPLTDNATNEDIDLMFNSESPVVKRVLMKLGSYINEDDEENENSSGERYPLTVLEGLVNFTNDSTMTYNGQTYYKWVKYEDQGDETSIPDEVNGENVIVLTTSLNPALPFTSDSPEWVYMIGSESEEAAYASPDSETYPKEALIHEDGSITYEE